MGFDIERPTDLRTYADGVDAKMAAKYIQAGERFGEGLIRIGSAAEALTLRCVRMIRGVIRGSPSASS